MRIEEIQIADVKSKIWVGSISIFSIIQEYNIIKQTGTTQFKSPVAKSYNFGYLLEATRQYSTGSSTEQKSREGKKFLMVDQLPSKQKVDSAYKIKFSAECVELYSTSCVIKFNADGEHGCLRFWRGQWMTPDSLHSQEVGIQEKLGWVQTKIWYSWVLQPGGVRGKAREGFTSKTCGQKIQKTKLGNFQTKIWYSWVLQPGWYGQKPVKASPPKLVAAKATPGRCQVSQHILSVAMGSIVEIQNIVSLIQYEFKWKHCNCSIARIM